jgi:hypothetical protein
MKVDQLIEILERGLDRAEEKTWIAFAINADEEAEELLADLKQMRQDIAQNEEDHFLG